MCGAGATDGVARAASAAPSRRVRHTSRSLARFSASTPHDHSGIERIGVLVTNLGTPDAPTARAVRRYLAEFLADPRVVDLPGWLWRPILHGVVLRIRPARSARAYATIWTPDGSPLLVNSRDIADALRERWEKLHPNRFVVALGMRYGTPSIAEALAALRGAGATRIAVLPLYPQYSGSTGGSTFDAVSRTLSGWRRVPALRFIDRYHDDRGYIDALAASVEAAWSGGTRPDRLLFSFHGLPRRFLEAGDPYHCECHATARLVAERLNLSAGEWLAAFQSRVGREEWLRPYTDETLTEWGRARLGRVDVLCPGFSADCLETLEEIAIRGNEIFVEAGGGTLRYIPALNACEAHVAALASLVERGIADWLARSDNDEASRERRSARARALGAHR